MRPILVAYDGSEGASALEVAAKQATVSTHRGERRPAAAPVRRAGAMLLPEEDEPEVRARRGDAGREGARHRGEGDRAAG